MRIEVSPSGRASCRGCKKSIGKGELRFGETYSIPGMDTEGTRYYHLECAATKVSAGLRQALTSFEGEVPNRAALEDAMNKNAGKGAHAFPHADKAPTSRAKCIQCREALTKDAWRVAIEREIDTGAMVTKGAGYLHPKCALAWAGENVDQETHAWVDAILANSGLAEADAKGLREQIEATS